MPDHMHGRPLHGLADGTAADWPDHVFAQISESQTGRCVRTDRWKYSVSMPERKLDSPFYHEEFLYDLVKDPHERNNLVSDPDLADVRAELAQLLSADIARVEGQEPEIRPAAG